jgi:hypothetical protein
MYERALSARLRRDRHHVLLLGPRQVGKSTLLGSLEPDVTLNLASPATFREFVTAPERLERELLAARSTVRTILMFGPGDLGAFRRTRWSIEVARATLDAWIKTSSCAS